MRSNHFQHGRDFTFRKPELPQHARRLAVRIGDMVPGRQRRRVFRTMADKHPEVVQPGRGKEDVIIVRLPLGQALRELVKPGLVAELIRRLRLGADVINKGGSVSGLIHDDPICSGARTFLSAATC